MSEEPTRRDFLRRLPALFRKSAESFAEALPGAVSAARKPAPIPVPPLHRPLDGLPVESPWVAVAFAAAEKLTRRLPFGLLLGASGEAFRIAWSETDRALAAVYAPLNTFVAACGVAGLKLAAAHGGPFEPALLGATTAAKRGAVSVLALARGPAVLLDADEKARTADLILPAGGPVRLSFDAIEKDWAAGRWPSGPVAFLRIQLTAGGAFRPLSDLAPLALRSAAAMLAPGPAGEMVTGLAAWEAISVAIRQGRAPVEADDPLWTAILPALAAGRAAAGPFLESIARATPPERRKPIEEAASLFRRVHAGDPNGDLFGTGLLPEFAECVLTDQMPDPGRLEDPDVRARAADLLLRVRDAEAEALGLLTA